MKYDVPYEVVDYRRIDPDRRIGPVGLIQTFPGGLVVIGLSGPGLAVDDSIGFDDDPETGTVQFMTPTGRVTLTELTLTRYNASVAPFVREFSPEFSTESAMQRHFMLLLEE